MNVSIRNIAVVAAISMLGSGIAYAGDKCCGTGSYNGGITNIPVVAGNNGCCGTVNSQVVAVPGVYVPGSSTNVGVGGANIGSTNVYYGGSYYGGSNYYNNGYYNSGSSGTTVITSGGGGGFYSTPTPVYNGMIDGLNVGGGQQAAMEKVMESKTITEIIPIRAVCMDDKGMPHPASRTDADDKIAAQFDGEVYRCMAGTHMEITMGRMVDGKSVFDGGKALSCDKGQALGYKGGQLTCVAQKPAGNCNERSLLRRFGPGIKFVTLQRTIKVESQRQAQAQQSLQFKSSMFVDGGVGQGVY